MKYSNLIYISVTTVCSLVPTIFLWYQIATGLLIDQLVNRGVRSKCNFGWWYCIWYSVKMMAPKCETQLQVLYDHEITMMIQGSVWMPHKESNGSGIPWRGSLCIARLGVDDSFHAWINSKKTLLLRIQWRSKMLTFIFGNLARWCRAQLSTKCETKMWDCCDLAVGFYVLSQDPSFGRSEANEEPIGVQQHWLNGRTW